jgi:hypothetical protein
MKLRNLINGRLETNSLNKQAQSGVGKEQLSRPTSTEYNNICAEKDNLGRFPTEIVKNII